MAAARELVEPLLTDSDDFGQDATPGLADPTSDHGGVGSIDGGGEGSSVGGSDGGGDPGEPDATADAAAVTAAAARRNGELCLLRGLYFLGGVSNVSWGRFAAIFYLSIGLNAFQIGILEGAMPVTAALCQPVWGVISDKTRQRKRVFLVTKTVASSVLLLQAVPQIVAFGFPAILCLAVGMSMFAAPGVLDAYALDVLGKSGGEYGTLRLWMAVSWGLGSTAMGFITGACVRACAFVYEKSWPAGERPGGREGRGGVMLAGALCRCRLCV
jgi:MFS family permease